MNTNQLAKKVAGGKPAIEKGGNFFRSKEVHLVLKLCSTSGYQTFRSNSSNYTG